jgi:hypothetical protein
LLEDESDHCRGDEHVNRPVGNEGQRPASHLGDEGLGHRRLEGETESCRRPEEQRPGGTLSTTTQSSGGQHQHQDDQTSQPPGLCARMSGPPMGGSDREEKGDTDHDGHGAQHHHSVYVLVRKPSTEGKGDDQAERGDRLHRHEGPQIEGNRLENPPRGLEQHSGQPHRLVQDLDHPMRSRHPGRWCRASPSVGAPCPGQTCMQPGWRESYPRRLIVSVENREGMPLVRSDRSGQQADFP